MGNIIKHDKGTVIINGGNPLQGCPPDWGWAKKWEDEVNEDLEYVKWSFDCGFKLDFDGSLVTISSRFYPPTTHYGGSWDGTMTVFILGEEVHEKKFDCKTIDELRVEVESYLEMIKSKIKLDI